MQGIEVLERSRLFLPSGLSRTTPAPLPFTLEEPFILKLQILLGLMGSSSTDGVSEVLGLSVLRRIVLVGYVNSATKSTTAFLLMVVLGMNLISNSPSLIAHLVSLPDTSGFCKTCQKG